MAKRDDMPRHGDPTELEPRPKPVAVQPGDATTAQLRQDIVSGATRDKVAMLDPAAAPLGTDDEAAGAPASPETAAAARQAERKDPAPHPHRHDAAPQGLGLRLASGLLAAVLLALLALWLSFR